MWKEESGSGKSDAPAPDVRNQLAAELEESRQELLARETEMARLLDVVHSARRASIEMCALL